MLTFMTKDFVCLTNSVNIINDALRKIRQYPSTAEDSGCLFWFSTRTATHFLQRLSNGLVGKTDLSATPAAAHLLNTPYAIRSTNFFIASYALPAQPVSPLGAILNLFGYGAIFWLFLLFSEFASVTLHNLKYI